MPDSAINEESLFFLHVENLCKGPAITCEPDTDVVEMARVMRRHNISGLVVVDGGMPVGIVSVRDCRNIIADWGGKLEGHRVKEIMSTGLVTIHPRDYAFEAIFKMAKNNIHRLIVVDEGNHLLGVITDSDLLRLQTRTPLYLNQEIENAESIDELQRINARILDMVNFAIRAGVETRRLVQMISLFNDAFTLRIIALMEEKEGIRLPAGAAYLVLGSEGRGEQTLRTDQDSAMVYVDGLSPDNLLEIERFSDRLVEALVQVGVPRCPGNTMVSNPQWRHSLSEWKQFLDKWISVPKGEHMVNFGMFQDLRALYGETSLEMELHDHILASVQRQSLMLPYVAKNIVRFPPPLGFFGRIRVERRGKNRGKVDLKKAGIFALTEGVSLLALEARIVGGSTWQKIDRLRKLNILSATDLDTLEDSFTTLVQLRLTRQLRALSAGSKPSNYVDPLVLNDKEREQFRKALKGVGTFLQIIRDRYQLDFISR